MKSVNGQIGKYLNDNPMTRVSVPDFLEQTELENKEAILGLFDFICSTCNEYKLNSNMAALILKSVMLIKVFLIETEFSNEEVEYFKRKASKVSHKLETLKTSEPTKSRRSHINKAIKLISKFRYRLDRSEEAAFEILRGYIRNSISIDYIVDIVDKHPHCFEEVNNNITIYDFLVDEFLSKFPLEENSYDAYYLLKLIKLFKDKGILINDNYIKRINKMRYRKLSKAEEVLLKELECILVERDIHLTEEELLHKYGKKVYRGLTEEDFEAHFVTPKKVEDRFILTLDPSLGSLKDDAISIVRDGLDYILGIHITDVASRVMEDDIADIVTRQKFKTYYEGPVRSIEMIDSVINRNLFSLDQGRDRQALSLYVRFSADGSIKDYYFDFDNIHINESLTYSKADEILVNNTDSEVYRSLLDLIEVTEMIRSRNKGKSSEYREIKGLIKSGQFEDYAYNSQTIIAEAMVLYNHLMAKQFQQNPSLPFIYRIHKKPEGEALSKLTETLSTEDLKKLRGNAEMLNMLKNFYPKAEYSTFNIGHYGLGLDAYSNSTSPGRRYADLFVQRLYFDLIYNNPTDEQIKKYLEMVDGLAKEFNFNNKVQSDYIQESMTLVKK